MVRGDWGVLRGDWGVIGRQLGCDFIIPLHQELQRSEGLAVSDTCYYSCSSATTGCREALASLHMLRFEDWPRR